MEDIEITTNTKKFKFRVNGLIIHNNKLLTLRMKNNISFCLPGGHVELGENTKDAILREMLEETNTAVSIESLLSISESFYLDKKGLDTHEISFYYIVKPTNFNNIKLTAYTQDELDKGEEKTHKFEWIDISKIGNVDFRPDFIKQKLVNGDYGFEHVITK